MPEAAGSISIASALFAQHGAVGVFSLRGGGVSDAPFDSLNLGYGLGDEDAHVDENMQRFLAATGLPMPHTVRQCHGTATLACRGAGHAHDEEADILITGDENAAVGVRIADCVPILIADPRRRRLAAVHAGWRGTAMHAAMRAVEAMQAEGSEPQGLLAVIGPCIGPCCYSVGDDTAARLGYSEPDIAFARIDGAIHADLALINTRQLSACGIPEASIEHLALCTSCHPQQLFSHRRDHGRTGRHLAVAAWARSP